MKKNNIKRELKKILREYQAPQEELYFKTGYHFNDVNNYIILNEIKRLLNK